MVLYEKDENTLSSSLHVVEISGFSNDSQEGKKKKKKAMQVTESVVCRTRSLF